MASYNIAIVIVRRICGKNMDTQRERQCKSTVLYDAGCGCLMAMLFGGVVLGMVGSQIRIMPPVLYDVGGWFLVPMFVGGMFLGVVLDYFWNYLILSLALRWQKVSIARKRRFIYTVIITAIGLLIDWLYYELTWGFLVIGSLRVPPIFESPGLNPGLQVSTILIPMVLIGAANYLASRLYLHLESRRALVVGLAMAVFTAPWLILAFVLLGW
jgi:uncharacterized protein (DUF2062 family)